MVESELRDRVIKHGAVWIALLILTVITIIVARFDVLGLGIAGALLIAFVKSSLVAAYFMNLLYDDRVFFYIYAGTLLLLACIIGITFLDVGVRW